MKLGLVDEKLSMGVAYLVKDVPLGTPGVMQSKPLGGGEMS